MAFLVVDPTTRIWSQRTIAPPTPLAFSSLFAGLAFNSLSIHLDIIKLCIEEGYGVAVDRALCGLWHLVSVDVSSGGVTTLADATKGLVVGGIVVGWPAHGLVELMMAIMWRRRKDGGLPLLATRTS